MGSPNKISRFHADFSSQLPTALDGDYSLWVVTNLFCLDQAKPKEQQRNPRRIHLTKKVGHLLMKAEGGHQFQKPQ